MALEATDSRGFSLGLTQADRQADWEKMSPMWRELARMEFDSIVAGLTVMSPAAAADAAQDLIDFLDFGDFDDILDRARIFVTAEA